MGWLKSNRMDMVYKPRGMEQKEDTQRLKKLNRADEQRKDSYLIENIGRKLEQVGFIELDRSFKSTPDKEDKERRRLS